MTTNGAAAYKPGKGNHKGDGPAKDKRREGHDMAPRSAQDRARLRLYRIRCRGEMCGAPMLQNNEQRCPFCGRTPLCDICRSEAIKERSCICAWNGYEYHQTMPPIYYETDERRVQAVQGARSPEATRRRLQEMHKAKGTGKGKDETNEHGGNGRTYSPMPTDGKKPQQTQAAEQGRQKGNRGPSKGGAASSSMNRTEAMEQTSEEWRPANEPGQMHGSAF